MIDSNNKKAIIGLAVIALIFIGSVIAWRLYFSRPGFLKILSDFSQDTQNLEEIADSFMDDYPKDRDPYKEGWGNWDSPGIDEKFTEACSFIEEESDRKNVDVYIDCKFLAYLGDIEQSNWSNGAVVTVREGQLVLSGDGDYLFNHFSADSNVGDIDKGGIMEDGLTDSNISVKHFYILINSDPKMVMQVILYIPYPW